MSISAEEIISLWHARRQYRGEWINRMQGVRDCFEGKIIVPLPELDESEAPSVANLLTQGVDQLGMRLSSVMPDASFPVARPGNTASERQASKARQALLAWWDMNGKQKLEAQRDRFLVAYGSGPVTVRPVSAKFHDQRKIPHWSVIDPLACFPSISGDPLDIEPHDTIIERQQTLAWLQDRYPLQAAGLFKGAHQPPDKLFSLLEYDGPEESILVVVGAPRNIREYVDPANGTAPCEVLERTENRIGMCRTVVPGRITLGRLAGNFDMLVGMFVTQSRLQAYSEIAIRKGIFPELWAVTHPGSPGAVRIVREADGRQGIIGEIENGTIMPINPQPGQMTTQEIDRLERYQRVQGSIPSDWGGESATNIRTAKRGEQVASSASDPTLGELQNILAESMEAEDIRAIAIAKAYWGSRSTSFYVPRNGKKLADDYRPNDIFESDFHFVKYSMPGVDAASIPIELGQRTGTGEISMDTARRVDPLVEDPDHERNQVDLEQLRHTLLAGLEAQAQQGGLDPHEVAMIAQRFRDDPELEVEDALITVHQELQQQQADMAATPPGAPEAQPGLAPAPPPGAPAGGAAGPPPLAQLLAGLRQPNQQSPAEQQLTPAGS